MNSLLPYVVVIFWVISCYINDLSLHSVCVKCFVDVPYDKNLLISNREKAE